jgi:hypothetical protein
MAILRALLAAAFLAATVMPALAADDVLDAIDQARKAYEAGDMTKAKQSLDEASQMLAQKSAERFAALLPEPLPGWIAGKVETEAVGVEIFGATSATRRYTNAKGRSVDVRITGDSTLVMPFAQFLINSAIAGAIGKLIHVGSQRAIQTKDGMINMVIADKFLVTVDGSADAEAKLAYAKAVDVAKLSKM